MKNTFRPLALVVVAALSACSSMTQEQGPKAVAKLEPTRGNSTAGTVTFAQQGDLVQVTVQVTGLKPGQEHGFHAHEKGDCSSGDGMSTGGHFNPSGKPHGPQSSEHHAGDMAALKADANGNANMTFQLSGVSIGSRAADPVCPRPVLPAPSRRLP